MIISSLKLQNFMNIAAADLQFQRGINVLSGKNGQGKSAVLEAIAFCLLGRRRGDSWKDYIKSKETSFRIELTIDHNGQNIKFIYIGEQKAMALSRTIVTSSQTYVNSECDAFIEANFDAEMLENVLFTMQDSPSIASMTSGERRSIFKKVFNTDFLEALEKLKEDQENLIFKRTDLLAEVKVLEAKQYHLPEGRIELIDENEINDLEMSLVSMEGLQASWLAEKKKHTARYEELRALKEQACTTLIKLSEKGRYAALAYDISKKNGDDAIQELENIEEEYYKIRDSLLDLSNAYDTTKAELEIQANPITERDETDKQYRKVRASIDLLKTQIETSKQGKCTHCGQTCSTEHIKELEADLSIKRQALENLDSDLKTFTKMCDDYKTKKESLVIKEVVLEQKKLQANSLSSKIDEQKNKINSGFIASLKASEEYEAIKKEISAANEKHIQAEKDLESYPAYPSESPLEDEIYAQRERLSGLKAMRLINNEKMKIVEKVKQEKAEDAQHLQDLMVKLNEYEQEEKDLSTVRQIFEVTLPNYINQKACTMLQAYMATFLSNTKDEFAVLLQQSRKGIDFLYKAHKDSDWLQAKLASGYESALLTLSFKCAVASAYKAKMLILDEPDKAATESASALLFQTITEDLKSSFEQIFIITHRNNSLEYLQENGALIYKVHQGVFEQYVL